MSKKFRTIVFIFLSLGIITVTAANLSPIEAQIAHFCTALQSEQLSLLEKLVNINSGTTNITGVHQVGEILRPSFEQLGFKTYWVEVPASMQRAGTLIAERKGNHGKKVLLIGHLDTVFPLNSPFQHFSREGVHLTGPGVSDDKGGDVVILYALKALHQANALEDTSITVVLTGDEENAGNPLSISRKPLIEAARHSDIALDFENAVTLDTASIARRGISSWTIETQGKEGHSSQIFQAPAGDGAIYELVRILNTMRTQLEKEKYLSFSPGIILGGTTIHYDNNSSTGNVTGKENVIAKSAITKGDLRFLTQAQKINAENKIIAIVNAHLPLTNASIIFHDGISSMPPTLNNLKLLKQYSEVSKQLGYGAIKPLDPGLRGAGDISHIAKLVKSNLVGLGVVSKDEHSTQETIDLHSLPIQTQRAAILIYRLIHNK